MNEGKRTGEFLLSEGNGSISREQVTLAAAAMALVPGTLLGKLTADGKYVAYADGASDGSNSVVGILYSAAPDLSTDQKVTIIARQAEVIGSQLTGLDAAGRADLAALGIVIR